MKKKIINALALLLMLSIASVALAQDKKDKEPAKPAAAATPAVPTVKPTINIKDMKPEKAMDTFNGIFMSTINSLTGVRDAASAKKARKTVEVATANLKAFSAVSMKLPPVLDPLLKESAVGFTLLVKDQLGRIETIPGAGRELIGPVNAFVKSAKAFAAAS